MARERQCTFCGATPATYIDGFYVCDSGDCDLELREACLERDQTALDDALDDIFGGYS
jgi:hypothetical protein